MATRAAADRPDEEANRRGKQRDSFLFKLDPDIKTRINSTSSPKVSGLNYFSVNPAALSFILELKIFSSDDGGMIKKMYKWQQMLARAFKVQPCKDASTGYKLFFLHCGDRVNK